MPEPFPAVPDLTHHLRQLLAQVPRGRVATCGELAEALGNRIAARWVGHYALHHPHDADCACHRIVRVGGEMGGYAAGAVRAKMQKLIEEGVVVRHGTVDLERFGFTGFVSDRPLDQLRHIQEAVQRRIVLRPRRRVPRLVGGLDVAYPQPEMGVAAYALVETATGRLVWSTTVRRRVRFPYISTYLSFREIPILLDLLDEVRAAGRMAEVLLVDGSGILHHRHAGIASHLGVVAALPTVGVTKKLLCGQVNLKEIAAGESRPVVHEDRLIGVALRPTAGSLRPIFISPGHRVDVSFCERLVRQSLHGRRLPEPIYWADRLSRVPCATST
jgi:deoxyribonuclease V